MRILLVEDDEFKARQIISFLRDDVGLHVADVAGSVTSAKRSLAGMAYDFVIIDMSLPTFDISPDSSGGRPQAFGGKEVVRLIERQQLAVKAVIVTQFEAFGDGAHQETIDTLRADIIKNYPDIVRAVVYFDFSNAWMDELKKIALEVVKEIKA